MIEIREFRAGWKDLAAYLIVAIALLIVLSGIMRQSNDSRVKERDEALQALQVKIQQTQGILGQVRFPENVAQALKQVGWQVKTNQPRMNTKKPPGGGN